MLSHFVTVCLALLPFAQCIQIHKHMKREEVLKTFQTEHDNVPDYHVVRPYHTLHKRDINDNSTRMVKVNVVGRTISLYLEPTEGLLAGESTPLWTVVEDAGEPQGLKYTQQPNILANIGRAYQDVSKRSAIVAYEGEDGETLFHGDLPEHLRIVPLPDHIHDTILTETKDLVDYLPDGVDGEADFRRSRYHVVFKRHERDMNANHDGIRFVERERRSLESAANDQSETSVPDIVYPEMLIIVDFELYKTIGNNLEDVARYVLAFWNAVDLRYRLLGEPIIRLNIAGIIVSLQPGGTPYFENNKSGSNEVDSQQAIEAMAHYFYKESHRFPFATYDFAMAMTGLDVCQVDTNGVCNTVTEGFAYIGGACNRNHTTMTTIAVGIVEDNAGYKGILSAAHEIGHLLGLPHDGTPESIDCPVTDGYLMRSKAIYNENAFQWSNCSLKHLYDFLSSPESICLHDKPRGGKALPRKLPGELMTLDEQCEKIVGTKACFFDARVCTALACYQPGSTTRFRVVSVAAEGSSCGKDLHCINGYCVSKKMRHVPYALSMSASPFKRGSWFTVVT